MSNKMATPATLFGVEEDAADSRSVIESVWSGAFFKRIAQKRNRDFCSNDGAGIIEFNQIAFLIVSTDKTCPWDNSIVYKPNASDGKRI